METSEKQTETRTEKPLKQCVFERIESENVCPRSRLFFHSRECFVWFFWFLSIVAGALAIAVSLFVVMHHQYALYEATHDNFFTFMVEALPYLWLLMFGTMVFVAVYNLRHTKHGYRKPVWFIIASSVVLSFAGGSALQLFGFGYKVDDLFGRYVALYTSQGKYEQRLWQDPAEGRLIGVQVHSTLAPTSTVIFEDITGTRWVLSVTELSPRDLETLASGQTVKLIGASTDQTLHQFHACGAFPWVIERSMTTEELTAQRAAFMARVEEHARKIDVERFALLSSQVASTTPPPRSVCATIAPVRKIPLSPAVSDR